MAAYCQKLALSSSSLNLILSIFIALLTPCRSDLPRPIASLLDLPSNDSPFAQTIPTNLPNFHSTQYYLDNDDYDDDADGESANPRDNVGATDVPRRRSANPPEVRCALNRTSASLCKASGTPIGCACDKLCHGTSAVNQRGSDALIISFAYCRS